MFIIINFGIFFSCEFNSYNSILLRWNAHIVIMYVPLHLLLNTRWTCIGCARSLLGSLQWWYHNLYAHWMSLTFTKMSQSMHNRIEWRAKTEFNSILSPMRDRCNSCDATIIPIASVGYSKCERNLISNPLKTEKKHQRQLHVARSL